MNNYGDTYNNQNTYNHSNHNQVNNQGDNSTTNITNNQNNSKLDGYLKDLKNELAKNNKEEYYDIVDLLQNAIENKNVVKANTLLNTFKEILGTTDTILKIADCINSLI